MLFLLGPYFDGDRVQAPISAPSRELNGSTQINEAYRPIWREKKGSAQKEEPYVMSYDLPVVVCLTFSNYTNE